MAQELPYLPSYKNVEELFTKIAGAKQPDAFSTRFLSDVIGLKSTGDRAMIALLKTLGFIDTGGKPTARYGSLKNSSIAKAAIAEATRAAYEPLFAANERANELSGADLNGLISQVAGSDSSMTTKIAGTFRALIKCGDFKAPVPPQGDKKPNVAEDDSEEDEEEGSDNVREKSRRRQSSSPEFHYNIQIHLPANATEETYLNIFSALRKAFK